jgi:uncharacterized membrane protein YhaH (DUF805 family)
MSLFLPVTGTVGTDPFLQPASVNAAIEIARRLHDFDCRALWAIVLFILLWTAATMLPSLGSAMAFLAMFAVAFKQGDEQANRFGPSPVGEL